MNIRVCPDSTGPVEITVRGGHIVLNGVVSLDREAYFLGPVRLDGTLTRTLPIVEGQQDADAPEAVAAYACKRCGARCVAGEKLSCDRGPCPMEPVSATVQAPAGTVVELVADEPPAPAPPTIAGQVADSLAKYVSRVDLPNLSFVLNSRMGDVTRTPLRICIDAGVEEGIHVSLDVTEGFTDADAIALFLIHALETAARQRSAKFSGPELLALYNSMKSEDVLANVEPGDHGDAILEAFGRRVIEATLLRMGGA
jgi:hypothetical protein